MSIFLEGKLDNQEIHKKLTEHKFPSGFDPSEELISSIIEQFWFHDFYNSFISDPVFLEYLIKYLNHTKPKKFNRFDFYQFLFDQTLKQKSKKSTLQLIALAFEQIQTDAMSPSGYEGLFKAVDTPKGIFDASWMQKNHLAKIADREGKKYFIWEHHTLTEFLTAEHTLQAKSPLEEFQKLAVLDKEGVVAFKPSWSGVLRFLLESPKGTETLH